MQHRLLLPTQRPLWLLAAIEKIAGCVDDVITDTSIVTGIGLAGGCYGPPFFSGGKTAQPELVLAAIGVFTLACKCADSRHKSLQKRTLFSER